jgi:hypothetical protein
MPQNNAFQGLETHIEKAINRLVYHMTSTEETPPVAQYQIRACQVYLDLALKHQKINELEQKILDMELQLAATQTDDNDPDEPIFSEEEESSEV